MSGFSEVRMALGTIVGDLPAFLEADRLALVNRTPSDDVREAGCAEGGRILVEGDWIASALRVSLWRAGKETLSCCVEIDPKRAGTPVVGFFTSDFEPLPADQVEELHRILAPQARPTELEQRLKPIDPACLTYTVREAARILGFSKSSIYEAITRDEIPVVRFGSRMRVPRQFIDEKLAPVPQAAA